MSAGIALALCAVIGFISVARDLPVSLRVVRRISLAYCVGYGLIVAAGVLRGLFDRDPSGAYPLRPALAAVFAVIAGVHGASWLLSRRRLARVRPEGAGAYRDPAPMSELPEPPRAPPAVPTGEGAIARFLLSLLALCAAATAFVIDSTNAVPCALYPRICSSRAIAQVLAHSREDWVVRRVPDASCGAADTAACGPIDHTRNEQSRVLAARGPHAVHDIAEVLYELPSDQFVYQCSVLRQCQGRVGSLMDLVGAHPHPDVTRALRRWLDLEPAPSSLRIEAALQLLRSGQTAVLPKLVALLCAGNEAGEGSSERARIPPLAREAVPYLTRILSEPGTRSCASSVSLEILLSIDSVLALEALEQLGRSKDPEQRAIVYRQLRVKWDRAPRRAIAVLKRLALDGPEPERACFSLRRVQELRLGRSADELYRFCQASPGTAEWRVTTDELAELEREPRGGALGAAGKP